VAAGKQDKARAVFEKAINSNRSDRNLNYRYALFLEKIAAPLGDIAYFLKRAFSPGDRNYDAHLRYARILFLNGDYEESRKEFQSLRNNRGAPYFFGQRMYEAPGAFNGHVTGVRHSHIFVKESRSQNIIFVPRENVKVESWRRITEGTKVKFGIAFNFRGPIGFDCEVG
jgi:tetratricopeptide (TPR) repeat protein